MQQARVLTLGCMLDRVNTWIWTAYFLLEAVGVAFISRPVLSPVLRGLILHGLQPGLLVAFSLDNRFLKHFCFAVSPTEVWFVSLVTLAINCVAFYVVLFGIGRLMKFSRLGKIAC